MSIYALRAHSIVVDIIGLPLVSASAFCRHKRIVVTISPLPLPRENLKAFELAVCLRADTPVGHVIT